MTMPEDPEINHVFSKHTLEMQARLAAIPEGKSLYKNYSDAWKNLHGINLLVQLKKIMVAQMFILSCLDV